MSNAKFDMLASLMIVLMQIYCCVYAGERILQIGQCLAKLRDYKI